MSFSPIRFLLNGQEVIVQGVPTTLTLLQWLREYQRLLGTKEGCAEGDCGACTIVMGSLDTQQKLCLTPINACIQFLPTVHHKAVFTVEYLRSSNDGTLHPVQQAMLDCHASQCGFCTPGFVMSLWHVYLKHNMSVDDKTIRSALSGNLCRCTGYQPIMSAAKKMWSYLPQTLDSLSITNALRAFVSIASDDHSFSYISPAGERFDAPQTTAQWLKQYAKSPQATIISGATDVALWSTKQLRPLPHLIYIGNIADLNTVDETHNMLTIGAGVSLSDAYDALCRYYPTLADIQERFASTPIRHAGTLGGNIANGSPIGDSMPALMALNSTLILGKWQDDQIVTRELSLDDFYLAYQKKAWQTAEVLLAVRIPLPFFSQDTICFASYKVSKRYDSDISAVCAAYSLKYHNGNVIDMRIAYGGMAAMCKRAIHTESVLIGKPWNASTIKAAQLALNEDFEPLSDMRASAHYRMKIAQNLLYRFYLAYPQGTRPVNTIDVFTEAV